MKYHILRGGIIGGVYSILVTVVGIDNAPPITMICAFVFVYIFYRAIGSKYHRGFSGDSDFKTGLKMGCGWGCVSFIIILPILGFLAAFISASPFFIIVGIIVCIMIDWIFVGWLADCG
jgi:hypothetical protein